MEMYLARLFAAIGLFLIIASSAPAVEIILPQNRAAYYASESIEMALAGLAKGAKSTIVLTPTRSDLFPLTFEVTGDGSTRIVEFPPYSLAPDCYAIQVDHASTKQVLRVTSGINISTMLLSQTLGLDDLKASSANFILSMAFNFGLLDTEGRPLSDVRGRRSAGCESFETAIASNLPSVIYTYWTACLTHQPFSAGKSWTEPRVIEAMRLLNFHAAQRLRRYQSNIVSVGTMDEPGLGYGRTPAGRFASGFPDWDEQPWYEQRGWRFTDHPASRPDEDWMKYMTLRCGVMKEAMAQARQDLKTVWPDARFATDLYAPGAVSDGADPLNQEANDLTTTHIFTDFGFGKLGAIGAIYLEKAHDPAAKVAHAMNGQLFGDTVPQPQQRDTYRLTLNCLLAAGLHSNWWLNTYGMANEDFTIINEPGLRFGPLFRNMSPDKHDVAILWSFTEACMRIKDVIAQEAKRESSDPIRVMIAALPENTAVKNGTIELTPYNVANNYAQQIQAVHQALSRAGYPAHILHEKLVSRGELKRYKTLVIVGQTFPLPQDVMQAIETFVGNGGRIVVDRTTAISLPNAVVTEADLKDPLHRWAPLHIFVTPEASFKTKKEASYFQTNYFMDEQVRAAVSPIEATMRTTRSRPIFRRDSIHLAGERHVAGEGAIYMVINGFEQLPEITDDQKYYVYNYAPYTATYELQGIEPGSVVYCIEGADWKRVRPVPDYLQAETASFGPGEMKLYLVAPRNPQELAVSARAEHGSLSVFAQLKGLQMPWPLTVTIMDPSGKELYRVYRATNARGEYGEIFPLGSNAPIGRFRVSIESPVGGLSATATTEMTRADSVPQLISGKVRIFDREAIKAFLTEKPKITIALGCETQRPLAEELGEALKRRGIAADVVLEREIIAKVRYPRIWSPYIQVYQPTSEERAIENMTVATTITALESLEDGRVSALTTDGANLGDQWFKPNTLATVGEQGYIFSYWYDVEGEKFFAPGCRIYIDNAQQLLVLNAQSVAVRTTDEVCRQWSRPWPWLQIHGGGPWLPAALPEAYRVNEHLILLGDSNSGELVSVLQASEMLPQTADAKYPGPGKALISFAWSPFALEKNVVLIGANDEAGISAGADALLSLIDTER